MKQHVYHVSAQRIIWVAGIQALLLFLIFCRLCVVQIFQQDKYRILSDDNRIRSRPLFPKRGKIYDRHQLPLAHNVDNYSALLIPEDVQDIQKVLATLQEILMLSDGEIARIKKSIRQKQKFFPTVIKEELTWDELCAIEVNSLKIPGVYIDQGFKRHYPLGDLGSHVLGYVSSPSEAEAQGNKSLMLPGAKVGKSGLEGYYEKHLQGTPGQKELEVNARGRLIKELGLVTPVAGDDLHLSLDGELQKMVAEVFKEHKVESGGAVILDAYTGEVLCLVSVPGFNPNLFYHGIDAKNWKALLTDPYKPMINKVIAGRYSPASIFKIIVALAALKEGHSFHEVYRCPGYFHLGKHRFHCWKKEGHGAVNLYQALVKSCDVYFYHLARKIGEKPILEMAKHFGLQDITHIDLPNEAGGFLADPAWKRRVRKESWYPGDTILTAIGQAYVLTTPLQMAVMMAQVVNGGHRVVPTLIKKDTHALPLPPESQDSLLEEAVHLVMKGLVDAVNSPEGTSYHTRIQNPLYAMGGKTGTAQVRRISMQERLSGGRKDHNIPWHLRDNALFVGFAPIHAPRYVMAVIAEHKGFGGVAAAPIASKSLLKLQELMEKRAA